MDFYHWLLLLVKRPAISFSWIILSLLVGLGYTTIYTSRLTNPIYTKPIDTFEDFAANSK